MHFNLLPLLNDFQFIFPLFPPFFQLNVTINLLLILFLKKKTFFL